MRRIKKIAMIGATGMLGIPVAMALLEAGFEVTALVRDPEAARRLLPPLLALVRADVRDEESLRSGLRGQDGLYLNLSVSAGERRCDLHTEAQGLENVLRAAREANVARIAYLSALIQDTTASRWWVIDLWRRALARIKGCGIAYTIFYPTNFMETLAQRHGTGRLFVTLGRGRHANYWIAGSDFGRQVARAFALPQAENREYYVQGPEAMTYNTAARRYLSARSQPSVIVSVPLWMARVGGAFSRQLDFHARIMQAVLAYREEFKARASWDELGKPTTTIEQFAARTSGGESA